MTTENKHWCAVHGCEFEEHTNKKTGEPFYSHKDGERWCNEPKIEKKPKITPQEHQAAVEAVKEVHKDTDAVRNRSMCISYAKDLVVAGKLEIGQIITAAEKFYLYMTSGKIGG